jgi:large subunit ribosomal protein L19
MDQLVKEVEKGYRKKKVPSFKVGDTVKVHTRIIEGDKERVQVYNGTVVGRKGVGLSETFSVTRIAFGYANEKVFPLHGPSVVKVEVVSNGDVRKSKLNYIRGKLGKAAKISAKIGLSVDNNDEEGDSEVVSESKSE